MLCFPSQTSRSLTHLVTAYDEFVYPGRLQCSTLLRLPRDGSRYDILWWKTDANPWVRNPSCVGGSATFATGEFAGSVPCAVGHSRGGMFHRCQLGRDNCRDHKRRSILRTPTQCQVFQMFLHAEMQLLCSFCACASNHVNMSTRVFCNIYLLHGAESFLRS